MIECDYFYVGNRLIAPDGSPYYNIYKSRAFIHPDKEIVGTTSDISHAKNIADSHNVVSGVNSRFFRNSFDDQDF